MTSLVEQVRPFLAKIQHERPSCFPPQAPLVVGVSGGPDSLALLHVLQTLYPPDFLLVAHVNHQLRPSAAAEAQFVTETAAAWGITCHVEEINVGQLAIEQKLSLEAAGRMARYQYFAQLAEELGAHCVLVGHHGDDQAETVLLRMLRGSGLAGLRGMLPVAPLPYSPKHSLIRPFLGISRADIEAYCQQNDLQPILDESNTDTSFLRNRVRHELLPFLSEYNSQIKNHLQQMATVTAADYELLEAITEEAWTAVLHSATSHTLQLKRTDWLALPLSLRRRMLRQAVQQLRPFLTDVAFLSIEQARQIVEQGQTGLRASLPGDLTLFAGYDYLTVSDGQEIPIIDSPQMESDAPLPLSIPGQMQLANGWILTAESAPNSSLAEIQNNQDKWVAYIDLPKSATLTVRGRCPGERFKPLGLQGQELKLKDYMINRKIPAALRQRWPLVAVDEQVIWIVGHQIAESVRVTADSSHIVKLQCQRA